MKLLFFSMALICAGFMIGLAAGGTVKDKAIAILVAGFLTILGMFILFI